VQNWQGWQIASKRFTPLLTVNIMPTGRRNMCNSKGIWLAVSVALGPLGIALAKAGMIGPNPATYFALGFLACLCLGGIAYGISEGRRTAREGRKIEN